MNSTEKQQTLQRSQRVKSQVNLGSALTPLSDAHEVHKLADRPPHNRRHHQRSASAAFIDTTERTGFGSLTSKDRPSGRAWPFDSTFTARGFDVRSDPFPEVKHHPNQRLSLVTDSKTVDRLPVEPTDDWWERLGAKAARFDRLDGRVPTAWQHDDEARPLHQHLETETSKTSLEHRQARHASRQQNKTLAIWRDDSEDVERSDMDFDYFQPVGSSTTSPFSSPALSRSHLNRPQTMTRLDVDQASKPAKSLASPSLPKASNQRLLVAHAEGDLDELTQSLLAAQDRSGVFAKLEHTLEWAWSPTISHVQVSDDPLTPSFTSPLTPSLPPSSFTFPRSAPLTRNNSTHHATNLSRAMSSHSLAIDHFNPVELEDSAWTERGELSAYARARRQQAKQALSSTLGQGGSDEYARSDRALTNLEWADESENVSDGDGDMDEQSGRSSSRRPSIGRADKSDRGTIREGLAAIMDVVGLGSWV
ncbi:hypothetical protein OIV83_005459 [Microbotryomycetes sp. JL201]|nr:hypothetical protein OIV83_005459 [Microbotryomycetes sp. JL201]